jgi:hypothetical protein
VVSAPMLTPDLLELAEEMAAYYRSPIGTTDGSSIHMFETNALPKDMGETDPVTVPGGSTVELPGQQGEAVRRLDGALSGRLRVQMRVRRIPRPPKSPDPRSESGLDGEFGTAYRNRGDPPVASG